MVIVEDRVIGVGQWAVMVSALGFLRHLGSLADVCRSVKFRRVERELGG